jgi:histidine triad (HIT) family protein
MSDDCIFCKIVAGDIPATKVYEDEHTLAFMDIAPIVKGHTLVIPKEHYDTMADTPDIVLARCMVVVKLVAQAQQSALNADGVNLHQANGVAAGQVVPHLHFHVIPRFNNDEHHWNWSGKEYDSINEMSETAKKISDAVGVL